MYAKLGDLEYKGLLTFSDLDREKSVNYAEHQLINGVPRLQKISARNLTTVNLKFKFNYAFCNPNFEINALVERMNNGEILPLVDGTGLTLGDFVITKTKETLNVIDPQDGTLLDVDVDVELKEYVTTKQPKVSGYALLSSSFVAYEVEPTPSDLQIASEEITVIDSALQDVKNISRFAKAVGMTLAKISNRLNKIKDKITTVQGSLQKALDAYEKAQDAIEKAISTFQGVLQSAENARNSIEIAKQAIAQAQRDAIASQAALGAALSNPSDPEAIKTAIAGTQKLQQSHQNVRIAGSEGAYLVGARKGWR